MYTSLTLTRTAFIVAVLASLGASAFEHRYRNVSLSTGVTLSTLVAGRGGPSSSTIVFLHGFPR